MADATVKVLSYADIRAKGACEDALAIVPTWYPEGFPLSEEAVTRLVDYNPQWGRWLLDEMAPNEAWKAYLAAERPAREAYLAVEHPALGFIAAYVAAARQALIAALLAWGRGEYDGEVGNDA